MILLESLLSVPVFSKNFSVLAGWNSYVSQLSVTWNHLAYRSLSMCSLRFINRLKGMTPCCYQHLFLCVTPFFLVLQSSLTPCNPISVFSIQQDHRVLLDILLPILWSRRYLQAENNLVSLLLEFFFLHPFCLKLLNFYSPRSRIKY